MLTRALQTVSALRSGLASQLRELSEAESRAPEALRALQVERLRRLLPSIQLENPFWRRRFAAAGFDPFRLRSLADLAALPPLDARDLDSRQAADDATGRTPGDRGGDRTGVPAAEPPAATRLRALADELRHVTWMDLDWRAGRAVLTEDPRGSRGPGGALRAAARDALQGVIAWNAAGASEADYRELGKRLGRARPELLAGEAGVLERFAIALAREAREARSRGEAAPPPGHPISRWRPGAVQSTGDPLAEETRELVQAVFGAPVFNRYAARETGEIAHECSEHAGLHVSMERVVLEIVRDGAPVPDGEDGEVLVSLLDPTPMPLLRYRLGDIGVRVPGPPCACGRGSERILLTDGRMDQLVTSPAGRRIHADYFRHLFEATPGVAGHFVEQETPERLVLHLVRGPGWVEGVIQPLVEDLYAVDPAFRIDVRCAAELPPAAGTRRGGVHSRVPVRW